MGVEVLMDNSTLTVQAIVQSLIDRLDWHVRNSPCLVDDETGEEHPLLPEVKSCDEALLLQASVLPTELAILIQDAQRYRWLREQPDDCDIVPRIDVVLWTKGDDASNEGEGLRLTDLDEAIDAAMKQEAQP